MDIKIPEDYVHYQLKPEDFVVEYDDTHKYDFFEDRDGDSVYGFGHQDPAEFAKKVNDYFTYTSGEEVEELTAESVRHDWIVGYQNPDLDEDDENRIAFLHTTPDDEFAQAITVISL